MHQPPTDGRSTERDAGATPHSQDWRHVKLAIMVKPPRCLADHQCEVPKKLCNPSGAPYQDIPFFYPGSGTRIAALD